MKEKKIPLRVLSIDLLLILLHLTTLYPTEREQPSLIEQAAGTSSGAMFSGFRRDTTLYGTYPDCTFNSTQLNAVTFLYYLMLYRIESIAVWKVPLFEWLPTDFGIFFHAYLVIETRDTDSEFHYWSFEKNSKLLLLQQTPWGTKRNVVNGLNGKPRLRGNYWKPTLLIEEEYIIASHLLFNFYKSAEIQRHNHKYDLMFLNCQHFAQEMFNMLTHKEKWDCSYKALFTRTYNRIVTMVTYMVTKDTVFLMVLWAVCSVLMNVCVGIRLKVAVLISFVVVAVIHCGCETSENVVEKPAVDRSFVFVKKWKPKLKKYVYIYP